MTQPATKINARSDFETLLDLMARMIEQVAGTQISEGQAWMNDAQALTMKLFKQVYSVNTLLRAANVHMRDGRAITFIDHASAIILARASLETFLVFHWIFQSDDETLRKFRHGAWRLGGLMDRLTLHPTTAEAREVITNTRLEVDKLLPEVNTSPHLQSYTAKQVAQLLAGNWRVGWSWTQEAVRAGFHKQYFENMYGHFCGYAHSSYISSIQMAKAKSEADQKMLGEAALQACVHVMALFITHHARLFPSAHEELLKATDNTQKTLHRWGFNASDMNHLFEKVKV